MTKEEKGILAVLKVQQRAVEKGQLVSVPINPCRYDLVLDDGAKLTRAQVKYGNIASPHSTGAVRVTLQRHGKTYSAREIDVLLVYLPSVDKVCWFTSETFEGRNELYIRTEATKNNQKKKCLLAEDHFW